MRNKYGFTRILCYLAYVTEAACVTVLPMLFATFSSEYGFTYEQLGRFVLISFFIQLFADMITVKIVKRIGFRGAMMLAEVFACAGFLMFGIAAFTIKNLYYPLIFCVLVYSFGTGMSEVLVAPTIEYMPTENKASNMSFLHAAYSIGQVFIIVGTVVMLSVVKLNWKTVPIIWALLPLINLIGFSVAPFPDIPIGDEKGDRSVFRSGGFILCLILMISGGAVEQVMAQWVSIFSEQGLGVSKTVGDLLGLGLFGLLMGIGRIAYGFTKIPPQKAMFVLAVITAVFYGVAVFSHDPFVSLLACGGTGVAVSLFWPATSILTAKKFPTGGASMFALLAFSGDIGCSAAPWLAGIVSDTVEPRFGSGIALRAGIAVGIFFAAVIICVLPMLKSRAAKN